MFIDALYNIESILIGSDVVEQPMLFVNVTV